MGALLAFEVQRQLRSANARLPEHLFLSARRAPPLPPRRRDLHALPENELRVELSRFNGTPERVLRDRELMALLLPTLRADFQVCETHIYSPEEPGPVPISAIGGISDPEAAADELNGWSKHTTSGFKLHMVPGDHFFIHHMRSRIISSILQDLDSVLRYGRSPLNIFGNGRGSAASGAGST